MDESIGVRDEGPPVVPTPVALCAFEGWNDAGGAASEFLDHLAEEWDLDPYTELDPELFHDFQVARPLISSAKDGERELQWPVTTISRSPDGRVFLVRGVEPSFRWRTYCDQVLDSLHIAGVRTVMTLGALLADVPHSRPIPVSATSSDPKLGRIGIEASSYEGPTGIVGVLELMALEAGFESMSLWAAVPHYVPQSPCPAATLALLQRVEDITGLSLPVGDLPAAAEDWRGTVDRLAAEDSDISEYVAQLEAAADTAQLSQTSGETIAREFERYLKQRGTEPPGKGGG